MNSQENQKNQGIDYKYIYRYTCHAQERELCSLEIRQLLGVQPNWMESTTLIKCGKDISAQRSPYLKYKLTVIFRTPSYEQLIKKIKHLHIESSYKVIAIERFKQGAAEKMTYEQRRTIERELGLAIGGTVHLYDPEILIGVIEIDGEWNIGYYEEHQGAWQARDKKPRHYSTALATRVARAIVNVAVPQVNQVTTLLDPCCGIGTVLLEACDQGIRAVGFDMNPLAVLGARENIAAFHYSCTVGIADMRLLEGIYDAAVLDLPYNHCSVLTEEVRRQMLTTLSNLAPRAVIVSVEPIKHELIDIGAHIIDHGAVSKTHFHRDIWLVEF